MRHATIRTLALAPVALLCTGLFACSSVAWRADSADVRPAVRPGPNNLAAQHAERRELAPAIAIWRDLAADLATELGPDAGPGKAYVLRNLGRAYLLQGEHHQARAALERACLLDPLDPRGWELLGEALGGVGQEARARQMHRQAMALREHDLRADFAAIGGRTGVAPLGQALQVAVEAEAKAEDSDWAQDRVDVGVDGMLTLRRSAAAQMAATPEPAASSAMARLEIRNGNGVTGMARALARRLGEPGVQVTRLSNAPGFTVRQTRIEYAAAHAGAARRLQLRLGHVRLQEVGQAAGQGQASADLRLVLGHDLARAGTAWRPVPAGQVLVSYR